MKCHIKHYIGLTKKVVIEKPDEPFGQPQYLNWSWVNNTIVNHTVMNFKDFHWFWIFKVLKSETTKNLIAVKN